MESGGKRNKRQADEEGGQAKRGSAAKAAAAAHADQEALQFDDPFGDDEIEEEEEEIVAQDGSAMEQDEDALDYDKHEAEEMNARAKQGPARLFRPGVDKLDADEELEYDNSAYMMLHRMQVEFPFLSFDFIRDSLGEHRVRFPKTSFMVGGTQAPGAHQHKLSIIKMSEMHKTRKDRQEEEEASDSDSDSDDDGLDDDAVLDFRSIKHTGAVNRVRSMPQCSNIVASWSDAGRVYMWDVKPHLTSLGAYGKATAPAASSLENAAPIFAFKGHKDEGYAMDWSPVKAGRLATGDCRRFIHIWDVTESGVCVVNDTPYLSHTSSVEDLQWSPTEESVFASCSVDLSVRIWDVRDHNKSMLAIENAHEQDVNVIAWNRKVPFLCASGSDDGSIKVWDLRKLKSKEKNEPVGHFRWHTGPIYSLEWHPQDDTVLVAAGGDNQVSVWDFGLEEDPEQANIAPKLQSEVIGGAGEKLDIPPQLLFLHQGQNEIKEVHFHSQIPGMIGSTAGDGFHVFIPEPLDPKGIAKYLAPTPSA
mmetsp:Transcript_15813/g.50406  ORF Transcript_15813/g.50406 Transcript_15813/m.50406 type:complete len:532 (+) Transcript_15813:107-1702(+)